VLNTRRALCRPDNPACLPCCARCPLSPRVCAARCLPLCALPAVSSTCHRPPAAVSRCTLLYIGYLSSFARVVSLARCADLRGFLMAAPPHSRPARSGSGCDAMAFAASLPLGATLNALRSAWTSGSAPPRGVPSPRPARPPRWTAVASQRPPSGSDSTASAGSDAVRRSAAGGVGADGGGNGNVVSPAADSGLASLALSRGASVPPKFPGLADEALGASLAFGSHRMRVFSGTSNPELANAVARYLGKPSVNPILHKKFADGETYVRIEESVRGSNVFLIQSTSNPANGT